MRSQPLPAYQAPPPQQRKHAYRYPAPQNPSFYQQPVAPHIPGRRPPPGQAKQPHVQPHVASNQPSAQPASKTIISIDFEKYQMTLHRHE